MGGTDMHMNPKPSRPVIKGKMPLVMPVVLGVAGTFLFQGGSFIPYNPVESEFFVYLLAAVVQLSILLVVGGGAMALLIGMRQFSPTTFCSITANSIVLMAAGLLMWGVVFNPV
jgi:hypothetical protein